MAKAGRPRALDDVKRREVCALVAAGCTLAGAGRYVNCSAKTIRREAERNTDFGEQLRRSQLAARLEPLRALRAKANTHWRAAAWLLERVDPEQFARYDAKLLTPEEVGDLLDNIRDTLRLALNEISDQFIAAGIVDAAREQANLPRGRRNVYAKLNDTLPPGLPGRLDSLRETLSFQFSNPGDVARKPDDQDLATEETESTEENDA
jgi:IS30 family transposase